MGFDILLIGEFEYKYFYDLFEYGVNVIFVGYYEIEVFGVCVLVVCIEDEFGIFWQFFNFLIGL